MPSRKEQIEAMLKNEPNDAELHYMLAMEHVSSGEDSEAVQCFRGLIQLQPNYPPAYHQAGRALQRLNRIQEAKAILQQGIPIAQKKGDMHAVGEMEELIYNLD